VEVSPPEVPPPLDARDLYRFFHASDEETFALRGVSLSLDPGEMVAIVGPSGSGKSTLLACLAGLDEPDGGTVRIAGERITRRSEAERAKIRARGVGVLLQSGNLLEHLSVLGNIELAQRVAGRKDQERARVLLAEVGLDGRADARPSTLSGGETARAGLALMLANEPSLLLADEPTGELDPTSGSAVLELLGGAARAGGAVCVVTHSDRVAEAADRIVRLSDGRVLGG
jgi:putative ABC transport system ATP-binding protein